MDWNGCEQTFFFLIWQLQNFTAEFTAEFSAEFTVEKKRSKKFRRPSGGLYCHKIHCFLKKIACGADSISDFSQPQNLPQNFSALRFTAEFTAEFFRSVTVETAEFTVEKKTSV